MNSTQVAKVIKNFENVLKQYPEAKLDMRVGAVKNDQHKCGTVHCHGGWYAVARLELRRRYVEYTSGADKLAKDLGFSDRFQLRDWAEKNSDLWGTYNPHMFSTPRAFKPGEKYRADNLQDIIDHWYEVHDRLWLREQFEKETI